MAMFDLRKFAAYVSTEYFNKVGKSISPVRLQKTLYFCFAFWGGFVRKGRIQDDDKQEIDVTNLQEYLFNANFEAWVYGPVIPEIYHEHDINRFYDDRLFEDNELAKEFIDDLLEDINEVSDFRLVDISHQDNAWKENFDYRESKHSKSIPKEDIIEEYVQK